MVTGIWRSRWIGDWRPDGETFWQRSGRKVAWRDLVLSVPLEHLGFALWTIWSVVILVLGDYAFSTNQLFWLVAMPNLVGAVLRIPCTFLPARIGGADFTVLSALFLLVPALLVVAGTFGSFIGYSTAFPLLMRNEFAPDADSAEARV